MLRHKFTLALNEKVSADILPKAAAIACASLVASAKPGHIEDMKFLEFVDADGVVHDHISALSLIVMKGKSGELRKFRDAALMERVLVAEVTRETIMASPEIGIDASQIPTEQEYLAVAAFGEIPSLNKTTGRLSLWR